jgi:hypothetical protein
MKELGLQHERETIKAFIQKERQERCLSLLSHPTRRRDFTNQLAHFKWFDPHWAHPISPKLAHTADEVVTLLRQKGAGPRAWVISESPEIDAQEIHLEEAIHYIWGGSIGTILSCIPGKLGFFRGEEVKSELLLARP